MTERPILHNPETPSIRVLIVCNERVIRAALRALVDGQIGTKVIGEAEGRDAALTAIVTGQPDVTLLDPDRYSRQDVAHLLQAAVGHSRIILLTSAPESASVCEALEQGAVGLVLKQQAPEILLKAIAKVHDGELWLDRSATARLIAGLSRAHEMERGEPGVERISLLTPRERQVVTLVGEGLRNSEIANRLCISEVTVRNHLTSTFRKLELGNRFQLVIYAFQHGLAALPPAAGAAVPLTHRQAVDYHKKTS